MRSGVRTLGIAVGMMALLLWAAAGAFAQTYTVTRTDDPNPGPCLPSDCSLRQAIMAANATTTVDDVVVLPANPAPYMVQYEEIALPIGDEVEVRGAGADKTVIKGDGKESIFFIGPFKTTLTGLTITGGRSAIQSNGELLVRGVAIEGNQWNGGTAGIITNGPLTVESSFLGFNHTEAASGGVIHTNAPLTILNSTIAHNTSKEGPGAISANFAVPVSITNSAVVSNRSEVAPMAAVGGSPLTVRNSIFADNRGAAGLFNCVSAGPLASLGGNVSDDATCGAGATDKPNVNPGLGTLELHGGSTAVYSLLAGSPAIDFASQCPPVDQRGVARPQGAACDSGPYEFVPPPAPAGDSELAMRVGKGKLRMNGKGRIRVRLTCPATEANPPCRGKLAIAPLRKYWPLESCDCLRSMMRQAAGRRFSISAGKTQAVVARLPRNLAAYIPDRWEPRKVRLAVQAEDAAGNRQLIVQRRKLAQAKRG